METRTLKHAVQKGVPYQLMRITEVDGNSVNYVGFFTQHDKLSGFAYEAVLTEQDVEEKDKTEQGRIHLVKKECPVLRGVNGSRRRIELDLETTKFEPLDNLYFILVGRSDEFLLRFSARSVAIPLQPIDNVSGPTVEVDRQKQRVVCLRPQYECGELSVRVDYQKAPTLEKAA